MKWSDCKLWDPVTEKDYLGNQTQTGARLVKLSTLAREIGWNRDDLAMTGRTVTENDRRYMIPRQTPAAQYAQIGTEDYRVTATRRTDRGWTIIEVTRYGDSV